MKQMFLLGEGDGMIGLFTRAIANKEKIVLLYIDQNNCITQRFVRVLKMKHDSILVFCYYRKKVRTLKLDNILSAAVMNGKIGA